MSVTTSSSRSEKGAGHTLIADKHDDATILFCDIVGMINLAQSFCYFIVLSQARLYLYGQNKDAREIGDFAERIFLDDRRTCR